MKDFKTLLNEVPSKKIVIGFGRFNPPTTGHELLINKVTQYARSKGSPAKIYVTHTEDNKKNPLKQARKIYYMKRMFGQNVPLVGTKAPDQRTIIEVAKHLNTVDKINEITLIAGSDRIAEYKRLLNKYNGKDFNFDKITVLSSGRRDPDSDMAEGMSATKMRTAATSGKFTDFKKGVPRRMTIADSKRLFNEVRKGMGLPPIREEVVLPTSQLREDYVAKKIFNIGSVVEDDKGVYEVMDRGANYISVSDEDGNVNKKWLHEVRQISEQNIVNDYHSEDELKYKGFVTENLHNFYEIKDKFLDLFESDKDPVAVLTCLKLVDQSCKILEDARHRGYALLEEAGADSIIKMKLTDSLNSISEFDQHNYIDAINADLADLLAKEPNMKQDIKEQKNLKIDPANKFRFTSADRIKVARIIAGSLGVDNPEKMSNPTQLINYGLRKLRSKRVTPEFADIVKKMLVTAKTAGIDYDRQYLPPLMKTGRFAVESKSFTQFVKEVSGSGVDPIVLQLRKNINLKGNYTFEFRDGSKGKMSPGASEGILNKYDALRRPNQKLNVSNPMGKSMNSLKDTLKNWDAVANKEKKAAVGADGKKKTGRDEPLRGLKNPMDEQMFTEADLPEAWVKTEADLEKFWKTKTEDVKATKERITKEKEADKMKHDKMMDRARTQQARKKNIETKPSVKKEEYYNVVYKGRDGKPESGKEKRFGDKEAAKKYAKQGNTIDSVGGKYHVYKVDEESEGTDGTMGVGADVTRKVRQGLRADLMMRMTRVKDKMSKAEKGSKEFQELYAEYKKCKGMMQSLPGKKGANEEKIWEVKRPSVDVVDTNSNYNMAKSIMSFDDYKKMLKLAGGIEKRDETGQMVTQKKRIKDEQRFKYVDEDVAVKQANDLAKGTEQEMTPEPEDKPKASKIKKKSGTPKSDDPYDLEIFVADPKADAMLDNLDDKEIDKVVAMFNADEDPMNSKLDIFDLYDDEELAIEVEDEDEEISMEEFEVEENAEQLNEVLSRTERIKARVRVRRTKARRSRAVKIALRRHSSTQVINSRARRLAVKLLKRRFFKKAPSQLSVGERERAEARIAKMRHVVKRIALKLAPKVRQMEKKRLHGRKSGGAKFKSALKGGRINTNRQAGRKTKGNTVGQRARAGKGYGGKTGKKYGG